LLPLARAHAYVRLSPKHVASLGDFRRARQELAAGTAAFLGKKICRVRVLLLDMKTAAQSARASR